MDSEAVSAKHLKAGEEYLSSLRRLGLQPVFLGWGREVATNDWVLGIVTSIVEAGGPLALNRLLFAAYNANATPDEISPFIVRVYSPEIAPENFYLLGMERLEISSANLKGIEVSNLNFEFLGVLYEFVNAYIIPQRVKRPGFHETRAEWQKFKRNVEKIAA